MELIIKMIKKGTTIKMNFKNRQNLSRKTKMERLNLRKLEGTW